MKNICQDQIIVKLGHCAFDDGWDGDAHLIMQCLFCEKEFTNIPEDALVIDATRFMNDEDLSIKDARDKKLGIIRECYNKALHIQMLNNDPEAIVRYVQEELELLSINNVKKMILKERRK